MNIWRVITAVLLLNILLVEARVITLEEEFISILDDDNKFWELFQNTFKNSKNLSRLNENARLSLREFLEYLLGIAEDFLGISTTSSTITAPTQNLTASVEPATPNVLNSSSYPSHIATNNGIPIETSSELLPTTASQVKESSTFGLLAHTNDNLQIVDPSSEVPPSSILQQITSGQLTPLEPTNNNAENLHIINLTSNDPSSDVTTSNFLDFGKPSTFNQLSPLEPTDNNAGNLQIPDLSSIDLSSEVQPSSVLQFEQQITSGQLNPLEPINNITENLQIINLTSNHTSSEVPTSNVLHFEEPSTSSQLYSLEPTKNSTENLQVTNTTPTDPSLEVPKSTVQPNTSGQLSSLEPINTDAENLVVIESQSAVTPTTVTSGLSMITGEELEV